jgi:hypothetical protein
MAHAASNVWATKSADWRPQSLEIADDPLGAMRGILAAVLLSILGFWLPLGLVLLAR